MITKVFIVSEYAHKNPLVHSCNVYVNNYVCTLEKNINTDKALCQLSDMSLFSLCKLMLTEQYVGLTQVFGSQVYTLDLTSLYWKQ